MANIQEKIAKLYPEATVEQADTLTITVDDAKWHALATTLRDDCAMDYHCRYGLEGIARVHLLSDVV